MEHVLFFLEAVKFFIGLVSTFGLEVEVLSYFRWFSQVLPVPLKIIQGFHVFCLTDDTENLD